MLHVIVIITNSRYEAAHLQKVARWEPCPERHQPLSVVCALNTCALLGLCPSPRGLCLAGRYPKPKLAL